MGNSKRKSCVYCGANDSKLTREHVFPDFMDRVFHKGGAYFIGGANKTVASAPTIADVCKSCNGGVLSELDSYGKEISVKYFRNFITSPTTFEYDYHRLLRWILKVSYNAARAFKSSHTEFQRYIPYIRGLESTPPPTMLRGTVMKTSHYNGNTHPPNYIGVGEIVISDEEHGNLLVSRVIYFYSYVFIILGWHQDPTHDELQSVLSTLQHLYGQTALISPNNNAATLDPSSSKLDYLTHRSNQIALNPAKLMEETYRKQYFSDLNQIPLIAQRFRNTPQISKTAIMIFEEPSIVVFAIQHIHRDLTTKKVPIEKYDTTALNPRAVAVMKRTAHKTFITISDLFEIGNPFSDGSSGINQSESNWRKVHETIRNNENCIYIGQLPPNADANRVEIVTKVKVVMVSS